jgi:hypothetical protein
MTASCTSRPRNQLDNRSRSLGKVVNRRRSGFSSSLVASITTTIKTFLPATSCSSGIPLCDHMDARREKNFGAKLNYLRQFTSYFTQAFFEST